MEEIFGLSNYTSKVQTTISNIMPFFRLPVHALKDDMIPDTCFKDEDRGMFDVRGESLSNFRELVPRLAEKHKKGMSGQRSTRNLPF